MKQKKKSAGGSVYAQLKQAQGLPRCSRCQKGFVTLKVISINGKSEQLCPQCIKTALPDTERTVPRQ